MQTERFSWNDSEIVGSHVFEKICAAHSAVHSREDIPSVPRFHLIVRDSGRGFHVHPAARCASCPDSTGTRTWMVV